MSITIERKAELVKEFDVRTQGVEQYQPERPRPCDPHHGQYAAILSWPRHALRRVGWTHEGRFRDPAEWRPDGIIHAPSELLTWISDDRGQPGETTS